jgi:holo-[acyl-carrier protein] synthase
MIRLGTDIVYIPRIQSLLERFGDRFLQRVYTPCEQENCHCSAEYKIGTIQQLAGRWAAKEAVVKALGTGWRGISYTDIEIRRCSSGAPFVTLHNKAATIVAGLVESSLLPVASPQWQVSLSHDGDYAIATAIFVSG